MFCVLCFVFCISCFVFRVLYFMFRLSILSAALVFTIHLWCFTSVLYTPDNTTTSHPLFHTDSNLILTQACPHVTMSYTMFPIWLPQVCWNSCHPWTPPAHLNVPAFFRYLTTQYFSASQFSPATQCTSRSAKIRLQIVQSPASWYISFNVQNPVLCRTSFSLSDTKMST